MLKQIYSNAYCNGRHDRVVFFFLNTIQTAVSHLDDVNNDNYDDENEKPFLRT